MMQVLYTIVIGFVIGLIARAIKPGDDNLGIIWTSVLGIAGSFLANFVGQALGLYQPGQIAGWIASVVGAIILLVVVGFIKKKA